MTDKKPENKNVFFLISAVMDDLSKVGISKGQKNNFDNYYFRGIDDVYNTLSKILSEHKLVIMPSVINQQTKQVQTAKGGSMNHTTLEVIYTFVSPFDGSSHRFKMRGEAMDRGDKSINKAFTAAYKYMCLQVFCIPLQGNEDADSESHEVKHVPLEKTGNKTFDDAVNEKIASMQQIVNIEDLDKGYNYYYKKFEKDGATEQQLDILTDAWTNKRVELENKKVSDYD